MFATLNRGLCRIEEALIALLLAAMTLLTFSQVVLRYGFNSGWIWSLEATTYMFGALLMIGISFAMRQYAHMNVDALVNTLPPRARRAAALVAVALCFAYVALMTWGAVELVRRLHVLGSNARDLPVPRWVLMSMLPPGFVLLGLRLAQAAWEILHGTRAGLGSAHGHARDGAGTGAAAGGGGAAP